VLLAVSDSKSNSINRPVDEKIKLKTTAAAAVLGALCINIVSLSRYSRQKMNFSYPNKCPFPMKITTKISCRCMDCSVKKLSYTGKSKAI